MSATTVNLVLAGLAVYVGIVAFVLALATVARRADDAGERQMHDLTARSGRFRRADRDVGELDAVPETLEGRRRRARGEVGRSSSR